MGLISSISLGVALAKPEKKIFCIGGDNSILMNLGSLTTIADVHPNNLVLIIIDNAVYGSTGSQTSFTSRKTQLNIIAEGAGFESITVIENRKEIGEKIQILSEGCHFVLIKTDPGNLKLDPIPLLPLEIKTRFMQVLNDNIYNRNS